MRPSHFGDSQDMAKRRIMQSLVPGEIWAAHPMWYEIPPKDQNFLNDYAAALSVQIVARESPIRNEFIAAARACDTHLLLDPDTGLRRVGPATLLHVSIGELIEILNSPHRKDKLTLIYDGSNSYNQVLLQTPRKLRDLIEADVNVHAVSYIAHEPSGIALIWASMNGKLITDATQRMQRDSHFPAWRFVDDGCGHVDN